MDVDSGSLRLVFFLSFLALFFCLERWRSARKNESNLNRLSANFGLLVLGSLLTRIVLPAGVMGAAIYAEKSAWGLLNSLGVADSVVMVFVSVVFLDFIIYWQHVISHRWSFLWRFHQVHHADEEMDVTTALRFHPIEILLSAFYKMFFVMLLGLSFKAVLLFEIILNASAMFTHSNISIPWERRIRLLFVTPSMHLTHHSQQRKETDSNYGFCLSVWDRWFNSYTHEPQQPFKLGLESRNEKSPAENQLGFVSLLWRLLMKPFN